MFPELLCDCWGTSGGLLYENHPPSSPKPSRLSCARPLQVYFPNVYDIKYLMKFCGNLHGGLNKLAETLDVARIGPQHQVHPGPQT